MKRKELAVVVSIIVAAFCAVTLGPLHNANFGIAAPQGTIATQQRNLFIITVLLMLIVVIPVFIMVTLFAWRYRASNKKATYAPDWHSNSTIETIWWALPLAIIVVLAGITYRTSHTLDPYRPLAAGKPPVEVQVVALQWKWLFIYPQYNIATVNYLAFPEDTPLNLTITSDAPMNSFWIPQLGGQVYAMSGMQTKLHLQADNPGSYAGSSANISGQGFADMTFEARAVSDQEFTGWVSSVRSGSTALGTDQYQQLAKPATIKDPINFAYADPQLFATIIHKYTQPSSNTNGGTMEDMNGNDSQHQTRRYY